MINFLLITGAEKLGAVKYNTMRVKPTPVKWDRNRYWILLTDHVREFITDHNWDNIEVVWWTASNILRKNWD